MITKFKKYIELKESYKNYNYNIVNDYTKFDFESVGNKGEILQELKKKYSNDKEWQNISVIIYLGLPHEIRSRISSLYQSIKDIKDSDEVVNIIKNSYIYKEVEGLKTIRPEILLKNLKKDNNYEEILKDFCELFLENKSTNYENEFLKYMRTVFNKISKMRNKLLKHVNHLNNPYVDYSEEYIVDYELTKRLSEECS